MVTVAAVALLLGLQAEGAKAARRPVLAPWDLFGGAPTKRHGTAHRLVVPLPKPRPAEAPAAEPAQPTAEEPGETRKPADHK